MHELLNDIKKMQGICHNEFDNIITSYIKSCKMDLKEIGILDIKLDDSSNDLIRTAIVTYVLSFLDISSSEMYKNSYQLQKDVLRHLNSYTNG